ncbi:MAG TPA: outer membrane lipid asymmetry maintenance protein MlaD [Steroidobacteraceae bacterium]|jgi:phospholipid/cholesterol/gamma-HCH transport system substrate-binding protein|nr:outer membrane lipid asymmetry maintenance protein MlaD [Steroidobacteraceae bacterium]
MRSTRAIELSTGLFALLGFAALFFLTTQISNKQIRFGESSYRLLAKFENVGSLKVGAPVSMAGVTIGRVEAIDFDTMELKAAVTLRIDSRYNQIPDDSDASIYTAGLLGGQYIGIGPGGSETYYQDGNQIHFTQSAIVLESLISKFLFSLAGKDKDKEAATEDKAP